MRACCAAACCVALASLCCDCKARERPGSSGAGRAAASYPPPAWCGAAPARMLVVCRYPVHRPGMPTFQCATGSQACRWAEQGNPCWLTDDPVAVGSRTETQGLPPPHALLRIRAEQTSNCADAVPCEGCRCHQGSWAGRQQLWKVLEASSAAALSPGALAHTSSLPSRPEMKSHPLPKFCSAKRSTWFFFLAACHCFVFFQLFLICVCSVGLPARLPACPPRTPCSERLHYPRAGVCP